MEQLLELDSVNFSNTLIHKGVTYSIFTAQGSDGIWIWFVMNVENSSIADISQVALESEAAAKLHYMGYFDCIRHLGWTPSNLKTPSQLLSLEEIIPPNEDSVEEDTEKFPLVQQGRWDKMLSWVRNIVSR